MNQMVNYVKEYEFLEDDDPAFIEISFKDACKFLETNGVGLYILDM